MKPVAIPVRIFLNALLATFLLYLIYLALAYTLDGSVWDGMTISKSARVVEYCELNRTHEFFRQKMNSYSNLIYFFLGSIVVQLGWHDRKKSGLTGSRYITGFPALSILLGACLIYLCFGSTFFHGSMTWAGQRADMNGAYGIAIILFALGIYRKFHPLFEPANIRRYFVLGILATIVFFLWVHVWVPIYILIPVVVFSVALITWINYNDNLAAMNRHWLQLTIVFTIGAAVFRTLDVLKIACDPESVFQGHVLWHFFIGMTAFFLYWFYRSEET